MFLRYFEKWGGSWGGYVVFFVFCGGVRVFWDKIFNFWDNGLKKFLVGIWHRPEFLSNFSANYRPFSAVNPHLKFWKVGNFGGFGGLFLEIFGFFFVKWNFAANMLWKLEKWFCTLSLAPKLDLETILGHFWPIKIFTFCEHFGG